MANIYVKKGDKVIVADYDTKPNMHDNGDTWQVISVNGNKLTIIPVDGDENNKQIVHVSRVLKRNGKNTDAMEVAEKQSNASTTYKPVKESKMAEPKTKKIKMTKNTKSKKEEPIALNLKELTKDGSELYSMRINGFDHEDIEVIGFYMISPDKKSYKCFNTYNGSLGRRSGKSLPRKKYFLSKPKAYDKLLAKLAKRGYKKAK